MRNWYTDFDSVLFIGYCWIIIRSLQKGSFNPFIFLKIKKLFMPTYPEFWSYNNKRILYHTHERQVLDCSHGMLTHARYTTPSRCTHFHQNNRDTELPLRCTTHKKPNCCEFQEHALNVCTVQSGKNMRRWVYVSGVSTMTDTYNKLTPLFKIGHTKKLKYFNKS